MVSRGSIGLDITDRCVTPPQPPPIRAAKEGGFGYSIVRPGQIKGDPFLAYSNSGAALSPDAPEKGSAKRMVSLRQGDSEAGDVNPSSVAEAFTQVKMMRSNSLLYKFEWGCTCFSKYGVLVLSCFYCGVR